MKKIIYIFNVFISLLILRWISKIETRNLVSELSKRFNDTDDSTVKFKLSFKPELLYNSFPEYTFGIICITKIGNGESVSFMPFHIYYLRYYKKYF